MAAKKKFQPQGTFVWAGASWTQEHQWTLVCLDQPRRRAKNLDYPVGPCDSKVLVKGVLLDCNPHSAGFRGIFPDVRKITRRHDNASKRHRAASEPVGRTTNTSGGLL